MDKRPALQSPDTRHHDAGPTGVGKSWIACALGHKACRDDRSVLYHRVPRLFDALALARGDGRYARLLKNLARVDLLILDLCGVRSYVEAMSISPLLTASSTVPTQHN